VIYLITITDLRHNNSIFNIHALHQILRIEVESLI